MSQFDSNDSSQTNPFGEVIYTYSRAQAIADGVLIDVSETAQELGFRYPVALTQAVWEDCVAWTKQDSERKTYQDQSGRLWDVLWMAACAIRKSNRNTSEVRYSLYRVPRDGNGHLPRLTALKSVVGPGDAGEPVLTIMLPDED
jgi:hypothetical protein